MKLAVRMFAGSPARTGEDQHLYPCALEKELIGHSCDLLMNTVLLHRRGGAWLCCAFFIFAAGGGVGWPAEYEVEGKIHQVITEANGYREETTNKFTVSVRDCGWLIQINEVDKKGQPFRREVGSTNGAEIFDLAAGTAIIISNAIPVGFLDRSVVGHLWLMYASQCYWGTLKSDLVTPVFDWKASTGANPELKVRAEWQLLNGPGSLPRVVNYLGEWDETNGFYSVTGTTNAGQTVVPKSFVFEERYAVAMKGMVLRKKVEVEVSAVRGACSRANLLPEPADKTVNVDLRLVTDRNTPQLPTYRNPTHGKWASVEEAHKLAPAVTSSPPRNEHPRSNSRRGIVLLVLLGVSLPGLIATYVWWRKQRVRLGKNERH